MIVIVLFLTLCGLQAQSFSSSSPSGSTISGFFIEAEDYDFDGGKFLPSLNTMPYSGDAYDGRGAVHEVDYHRTEDVSITGTLGYRVGDDPNVPIYRQVAPGTLDLQRGDFQVTNNYKIGWAADGDWLNYTRTFTNGNYLVYAVQSHGDAAGTPNKLRLRMGTVTNGQFQQMGAYQAPSTGDYAHNALNQLMDGPVPAVVHLSGTTTLRIYQDEGDFDWFMLVPTTNRATAIHFVIEAEDFDFAGGKSQVAASTMPLSSELYANLAAVPDVDYHVTPDLDDPRAQDYRLGEVPNVRISENRGGGMNVRGTFSLLQNYRVWIDSGEWFNYTRNFPEANYRVYAALSHGDGGPTSGSLQGVTRGSGMTARTLTNLGTFFAAGGTGGWGINRFVPLTDGKGNVATVHLAGTNTVRYSAESGDFDYLVFVAVDEPAAETRIQITRQSGDKLLVSWNGGGTLQSSGRMGAGAIWTNAGTGSSVVVSATGAVKFYRVLR